MEDHTVTRQLKRAELTEASAPTMSKRPKTDVLEERSELQPEKCESESPLLLPSSDLSEKINVPLASGANSDPSALSPSMIGNNYHVFLSFRGSDTRNGFVDHLYQRLKDVGLNFHPNLVFRDDEDLPVGKDIAANLISAIKHSKVSIPVISENYAASQWCLRELTQIVECVERGEQKVLPVLYKVECNDVRNLLGKFGDAFRRRKHRFDKEVRRQGKEALKKVLDFRVIESEKFASGHEGKLVKELVESVLREQQVDFQPRLPEKLVAIDDRVAEVMKLMDTARLDTRIIGICGIGGIGKTVLATIIYNKLFDKFECRCFLKDTRETINREGIKHVQSLLISDITKRPTSNLHDSDIGIRMIQSSCKKKKVLILLDDVDHPDHLDKLIGGCSFEAGSRIFITCRDMALLKSEYKRYELKEMNSEDSLHLFSIYAFEGKPPPKEVATLSHDIVATTGGLPLALTVIGSRLKGEEDLLAWGDMLEKLRKAPDKTVQQKLMISYDSLEYEEKQMFLDIACFFIGTDKRIATYLWDDLKFFPRTGLKVLINRSLINVDDDNKMRMHDQLRDLGRAIACPVDEKPWDHSRLWDEKAMKVLGRKEENENIEALLLDERSSIEFMEQKSFTKMPNLKFLGVKYVDFNGDFKRSLAELRWLKGEISCHCFKATNFHLEKLLVLDLSSDHCMRQNWRGWSIIKMERLKVLNLSSCVRLRSTPNLSSFKNLEMLILKDCICLEQIDPSIGDVKRLVSLNLTNCKSLKKLPEQLGELENLEELLMGGTHMKEIPSSFGKLGKLIELDLSDAKIKKLPESFGELNKLKILRIRRCSMEMLPSFFGKLQSLQEFDAYECYNLEGQIHVDKGELSSLKTLRLSYTRISSLPENLDELYSLEHLDLFCCRELQSLPKPSFRLSFLRLTCRSNEPPLLSHLKHLKELTFWYCVSLQSIPELPSCIWKLHVWGCPKLERLSNLSNLEFLSELRLEECYRLKKLDGLEALKSLRVLDLSREDEWYIVNDFDAKEDNLHVIRGLEKLGSLEAVNISGRKHIQVLDLSKSEHLKELDVKNCKSLVEIRCPSKFLKLFYRDGCESLRKFPDFLPHEEPHRRRRKRVGKD